MLLSGELVMSSAYGDGAVGQRLNFINSTSALLSVENSTGRPLSYTGDGWVAGARFECRGSTVLAMNPSGEVLALSFIPDTEISLTQDNYKAEAPGADSTISSSVSSRTRTPSMRKRLPLTAFLPIPKRHCGQTRNAGTATSPKPCARLCPPITIA